MLTLIILGLAAWIATSTIVEAEVFRDVREATDKVHAKFNNWGTYKLRYLIHCHMCTGIWVSAVIALFVAPVVGSGFVGWGLTALAIKGIAHLLLVVQKLAEAYTDKSKVIADNKDWNVPNRVEVNLHHVNPPESHINHIRSLIQKESSKNNVGWPQ